MTSIRATAAIAGTLLAASLLMPFTASADTGSPGFYGAIGVDPTTVGDSGSGTATPAAPAGSSFLQRIQGGTLTTGKSAGFGDVPTPLPIVIGGFINAAMGALGIILLVLTFYGGFLWMTAQGKEEQIKKAKNVITSTVIGLIIVMMGYVITNYVTRAIATATAPEPTSGSSDIIDPWAK